MSKTTLKSTKQSINNSVMENSYILKLPFYKRYYYHQINALYQFLTPKNTKILELTSSTIKASTKKVDYILLPNTIGQFDDIQSSLEQLHQKCHSQTKLVISYYNFLWEPIISAANFLRLRQKQPQSNWLSNKDIKSIVELSGFEVIKSDSFLLCPIYLPFISNLLNRYAAKLPVVKSLCLLEYIVIRPQPTSKNDYTVSVVIPARNEAGNIEKAVQLIPTMGKNTEIIFVEGGSSDNTWAKIQQVVKKYSQRKNIVAIKQLGRGKGDAVRTGFNKAHGDILMILDADLTMPPENLPKFYRLLQSHKAEFAMGSRLVYPMQKQAMRLINMIGNKLFSLTFSWILNQPIKDTLCGTKVLFRQDYTKIVKNRPYFGNFDPFGDFDLIFGASKLNLKIVEIPIHYQARTYGQTNISRFSHGWLLIQMTFFAMTKLKFI